MHDNFRSKSLSETLHHRGLWIHILSLTVWKRRIKNCLSSSSSLISSATWSTTWLKQINHNTLSTTSFLIQEDFALKGSQENLPKASVSCCFKLLRVFIRHKKGHNLWLSKEVRDPPRFDFHSTKQMDSCQWLHGQRSTSVLRGFWF